MTLESIDILKALLDLGFSAILLYFLLVVWKDRKESVDRKDRDLADLNKEVLNVVRENTQVQESLKQAVSANTEATRTLTNRIFEMINGRK